MGELIELLVNMALPLFEKKGCFAFVGGVLLLIALAFGVLELLAMLESC